MNTTTTKQRTNQRAVKLDDKQTQEKLCDDLRPDLGQMKKLLILVAISLVLAACGAVLSVHPVVVA